MCHLAAKTNYSVDLVSGRVSDTLPMGLQSRQDVWGAEANMLPRCFTVRKNTHSNIWLNTNQMCLELFGCAKVNVFYTNY